MKAKILILISFILFSCGTRTKQTEKEKTKTSGSEKVAQSENIFVKSSAEAQTDLSQYLKQSGLKINSTGKPYTLQYNGVVFSGDANLDFSDREEKLIIKTIRNTITSYESEITQKSVTDYNTVTTYKSMDLKSERSSWWLYVLLYLAGLATIPLIKQFIKK